MSYYLTCKLGVYYKKKWKKEKKKAFNQFGHRRYLRLFSLVMKFSITALENLKKYTKSHFSETTLFMVTSNS